MTGAECEWGTVLLVERPRRIVLAWQLSPKFEFDPDPARATEVEVPFEPHGGAGTSVTLVHRRFEVHGGAGAAMRDEVSANRGWPRLLSLYAEYARAYSGPRRRTSPVGLLLGPPGDRNASWSLVSTSVGRRSRSPP
jgi:hypothetical protein